MPRTGQLTESSLDSLGADGAAVAILTDGARSRDLLYATDSVAARIDELQFTLGEGPCLEAFVGGSPVTQSDISERAVAARWPAFSAEVVGLGVHGIFAFPILVDGAQLGLLELYRRSRNAVFTAAQFEAGQSFSEVLGATVLDELQSYDWSLDESDYPHPKGPYEFARGDVHAAIGMLAIRLDTSASDAGSRLRARAYADSRSISSMAHDIVHRRADFSDRDDS